MDLSLLKRRSEFEWVIEPRGKMRVPGVLFASEPLVRAMDHKVFEQVTNVATLPGIRVASMAMPDAHWGYGFAVGGVAAFDPDEGVVSAGGVGFDISCGVRCLRTRLTRADVEPRKKDLADALFRAIPAGVGSRGRIRLSGEEMDRMLRGGARWAVEKGWGERGRPRAHRGGRADEGRPAGGRLRARPGAHARRGRERSAPATTTSRCRRWRRCTTPAAAEAFGLQRGRRRHLDPLRLARLRPPDRHRGAARDARRGPEARHRPPRPRARLRPGPLDGGRALPRRHALRHQRGPRQPPGPRPPHARGLRLRPPAVRPDPPLRRLAQHLQGRDARGGRQAARGLRPPQGRDAGVGAGAPGAARPPAARRPAGAHRRHDGHVELGAGRHRERHARELRLGLPRRGPRA